MESELLTKESVEAIPLGDLKLSIFSDSFWGKGARRQKLRGTILELLKYVDGLGKGGFEPLRLVRLTTDFASEVASWQKQLARPEVLSPDCVGKMFVWGDGAAQSTYAVIILPDRLAIDLIEGDKRSKAIAKGTLVHEIVHIHDECELLRDLGPRAMPMNNDWLGIRRVMAEGIWTEFSADFAAYNWHRDYLFEELVQLAAEILKTALEEIYQRIIQYREHGNVAALWQSVGSALSRVFNQIGRSTGLLVAAQRDGNDQLSSFFECVDEVSADWGQLARQLVTELNVLLEQNTSSRSFSRLERIVEKGFLASGLHPIIDEQGLRVEIAAPFPD